MTNAQKNKYWKWSCALAIVLSAITFTPLILPQGTWKPTMLGIPYSLWTTYLITIVLVVLTWLGSKVHPGVEEEQEVKP